MPENIAIAILKKLLHKNAISLLAFFFSITAFASSNHAQPPAKFLTKFPFTTLTGGIVIVQARLGHHLDSLNFILDTGSGGISLDSTTVDDLKLTVTPTNRTVRGIAGIKTVSFVMNEKLILPRLLVDSLNFHIIDYSLLTSVYGIKIDGIIGYNFLSRYITKINYDNSTIEVWEPGTISYPRRGFTIRPYINNIPIFSATVIDRVNVISRFYLDTGGGLCLLLSERFAKDSNIMHAGKRFVSTQAEGLGGKKSMLLTTVKEVKLGPYRFKKVPTYILDDDYNITSYPQLGGLVGNDLLRRFNLVINYRERVIHLTPNTHFAEPFDYSYTGLGMYVVDGVIVIEDVIAGSPAEKAGFIPGDVVVSIEANLTRNIQAYKAMLQVPGAKLKFVISRDGELMELTLKVANILAK